MYTPGLPDELHIRQAMTADLDALLLLQATAPEAAQWSAGSLFEALPACTVAQRGDRIAGFLLYRPLTDGEREILNLAVAPEHRRRGVAARLLENFLAAAPGDVYLEVRRSNLAAQALYKRFGFNETGVRPAYYHRPVEDAVMMKRVSGVRFQDRDGGLKSS